jgi:hypothetical protein
MLRKLFWVLGIFFIGCQAKKEVEIKGIEKPEPGTFAADLDFIKKYKNVIVLKHHQAQAIVVKDFQGRVLTSTSGGMNGTSYGWINYDLISSGIKRDHINPFGGEDRFWIGPEGGQFAVFFKKGDPFDFNHWQTPSMIDVDSFEVVSSDSLQVTFKKRGSLTNYQGFTFVIGIERQVRLLLEPEIESAFGISVKGLRFVAFESRNTIANWKKETWTKKNGLISIWILGMFRPSDKTTVVIPFKMPANPSQKITDDYFGAIPPDRILKADSVLFFKGDGKYRGKIGIPPSIAKSIAGSYDAEKHILTLIRYDLKKNADYINSKWESQKAPYQGDAVNSYNDGPVNGSTQLGPFYELESSSPVRALGWKDSLVHRHATLHLEGPDSLLNRVAEKVWGVSLQDVRKIFSVDKPN